MDSVRSITSWVCPETLRRLRERLADLGGGASRPGAAPFRLPDIDDALPEGGLRVGAAHEILSSGQEPAISLLAHLAHGADAHERLTVWIGAALFPSVWTMARCDARGVVDPAILPRHLLVRAARGCDRLWAADLALRSAASACVTVDASSFDAAATRRLQLAAESTGALCLLSRPARDLASLSTAATRWLVEPALSPHHSCARWTVRLLRCKGLRPTTHTNAWTVDIPHAPRNGHLSPILRDGPSEAFASPHDPHHGSAPGLAITRRTG